MFWNIYNIIAGLFIATQALFIFQMIQNYRYALNKSSRTRDSYKPVTLLTVPCKGIDKAFEKNITSLYKLDYDSYYLNFVVEDASDPAYEQLNLLKENRQLCNQMGIEARRRAEEISLEKSVDWYRKFFNS